MTLVEPCCLLRVGRTLSVLRSKIHQVPARAICVQGSFSVLDAWHTLARLLCFDARRHVCAGPSRLEWPACACVLNFRL